MSTKRRITPKIFKNVVMFCNVTVNGTTIPKDPEGNDMCVLFLKYGRCRFKQKCKKSHWVPPLPEEPYPDKPPLPNNGLSQRKEINDLRTKPIHLPILCSDSGRSPESCFLKSQNRQEIQLSNSNTGAQHYIESTTAPVVVRIIPCIPQLEKRPTSRKAHVIPRRFSHVFQDNENSTRCAGIEKMFAEAAVYYDRFEQKVLPVNPPQNKAEKRHLKLIRRLHWNYAQQLKERLRHFPPSYHLKFDKSKVNFTRLRPYIYVLLHECLCPGVERKHVKPSTFHYLVADTLTVYLEMKYSRPEQVEIKLQQWGVRAVRARQCIDHLWHVMARSSKTSEGCIDEIFDIEKEVLKNSRTAMDYAYACSHALKQTKLKETTLNKKYFPRKVCSTVTQGLNAKRKSLETEKAKMNYQKINDKLSKTIPDDQETIAEQKMTIYNKNILADTIHKKRKRSKQFKNVSLHERKKMKTRCLDLLTNLT